MENVDSMEESVENIVAMSSSSILNIELLCYVGVVFAV